MRIQLPKSTQSLLNVFKSVQRRFTYAEDGKRGRTMVIAGLYEYTDGLTLQFVSSVASVSRGGNMFIYVRKERTEPGDFVVTPTDPATGKEGTTVRFKSDSYNQVAEYVVKALVKHVRG